MGASATQLLTVEDVLFIQETRIKSTSTESLAQVQLQKKTTTNGGGGARRRHGGGRLSTYRRRRTIVQSPRRSSENGRGTRVKTLKKLIPNGETMAIDGLFKETADYVLALEMRVKVMQLMVHLLDDDDDAGSEF